MWLVYGDGIVFVFEIDVEGYFVETENSAYFSKLHRELKREEKYLLKKGSGQTRQPRQN